MGETGSVLTTVTDGVAIITLNRPDKLNALDRGTKSDLLRTIKEISEDKNVGAAIVTGAGRAFCAGGDITEMSARLDRDPGEIGATGWRGLQSNQDIIVALHNLPIPTIAAVNGPAAGLGFDLALACDFIVASEKANFRMSYALRGLVPDGGGMYFLPRRVGLAKAKELIFAGEPTDATTAVDIGLADRVAAPEHLVSAALAWAGSLARQSAIALALAKQSLNGSFETTLEQAFATSRQAQAICYSSTDHKASIEAFLKK